MEWIGGVDDDDDEEEEAEEEEEALVVAAAVAAAGDASIPASTIAPFMRKAVPEGASFFAV